jgi:hypothetical protein
MKQVLLTINLLFYITLLLAQPNFSKAYRVHDNEDFLCGFGSLTVTDSAYYISGGTNDTLYGYSINRGMLMKIRANAPKLRLCFFLIGIIDFSLKVLKMR